MLASQLCVFHEKTDPKSKWVKKTHSMVVLSGLSIEFILWRFRSAMLCRNLMTMHAKWMYNALTQGITTIKIFSKYKKCYCWYIYHQKKPQEAVSNVEITVTKQKQLVRSKIPSISYPYFARIFKFFVVTLKLLRKSSDFLLLGGCG